MKQYHKIQTVFKRDMENNGKTLLEGQFSMPEFEYLKNNVWVFTEKVDGINIRVMWQEGRVEIGGKPDTTSIPSQLVSRLRERFPDDSAFKSAFPDCNGDVCLYGEGYGPNIQKCGGNYRDDQDFVLFDVKVGSWWLERPNVLDVSRKLGLDAVPVIGGGTLSNCVDMVRAGIQSHWGEFQAEGIVARPRVTLFSRNGERIITKVKCRDFG